MKKSYKPPEISNGDLRVPVTFFRMVENEGPYLVVAKQRMFSLHYVKFTKAQLKT